MASSTSQNGSDVAPKTANCIPDDSVRSALEAILSSNTFRDSEILKRFLRYSVEHTLRGEQDELKEYRLGLEVFDRASDFDPRLDPVVRMTARRLRTKLEEYYEDEGAKQPIRIHVPKGGYGATFLSAVIQPSPQKSEGLSRRRLIAIATVAALLSVIMLAGLRRWTTPAPSPAGRIHSVAVLPSRISPETPPRNISPMA